MYLPSIQFHNTCQCDISTDKKAYVPPHLRNRQRPAEDTAGESSGGSRYTGGRGGRSYGNRNDQDRNRGGYRDRESRGPRSNNRWSGEDGSSGGSRYGGRDRKGYDRDGHGHGARVNERGYHGDIRRNERLEHELFGDSITSGINFDKVEFLRLVITISLIGAFYELC